MYAIFQVTKQMFEINNVTILKAYIHRAQKRIPTFTFFELHRFLTEDLKLQEELINNILVKKARVKHLLYETKDVMQQNYEISQAYNIRTDSVESFVDMLHYKSALLENRAALLQELGVPQVSMRMIQKIASLMQLPVKDFKKHCHIPQKENVMANLEECANPFPGEMFHTKIERLTLTSLTEDEVIYSVYLECFKHFRHWKFGLTSFSKRHRCYKYMSFTLMRKLFDEMHKIQLDISAVKKHEYLLNIRPSAITTVINTFKDTKIGGMDVVEFIKLYPKVLCRKPLVVKDLLDTMKEHNVLNESLRICPHIVMLTKEEFVERIREYENTPELKIWRSHKRFIHLIYHLEAVKARLKMIRKRKLEKWTNIHIFTTHIQYFLQYSQGLHTINAFTNISYILWNELQVDKHSVIQNFKKHPHYKHIPIERVWHTTKYLKQSYSKEDIIQNIHIILYDHLQIQNVLKYIQKEYSEENGYSFTPSQQLALCLYFMEKGCNFSGNGVWTRDEYDLPDIRYEEDKLSNENVCIKLLSEINSQH